MRTKKSFWSSKLWHNQINNDSGTVIILLCLLYLYVDKYKKSWFGKSTRFRHGDDHISCFLILFLWAESVFRRKDLRALQKDLLFPVKRFFYWIFRFYFCICICIFFFYFYIDAYNLFFCSVCFLYLYTLFQFFFWFFVPAVSIASSDSYVLFLLILLIFRMCCFYCFLCDGGPKVFQYLFTCRSMVSKIWKYEHKYLCTKY